MRQKRNASPLQVVGPTYISCAGMQPERFRGTCRFCVAANVVFWAFVPGLGNGGLVPASTTDLENVEITKARFAFTEAQNFLVKAHTDGRGRSPSPCRYMLLGLLGLAYSCLRSHLCRYLAVKRTRRIDNRSEQLGIYHVTSRLKT